MFRGCQEIQYDYSKGQIKMYGQRQDGKGTYIQTIKDLNSQVTSIESKQLLQLLFQP